MSYISKNEAESKAFDLQQRQGELGLELNQRKFRFDIIALAQQTAQMSGKTTHKEVLEIAKEYLEFTTPEKRNEQRSPLQVQQ